jgi:DNA polymerase (family 10)
MGFSYFTVTEHSQTSSYAGGLKIDDLKRQWDEIDALNEKLEGLRLLKGIESDILEDGSLDYPDALLEQLDVVIGSIHQRYGQDENAMTRRVLNALDNPHLQIWGHPTGRLLNKREPAPLRMEEILDKAARNGVAVEVNGCPDRLDLKAEHVRMALQRNLKIVISTDAHSVRELHTHLPLAVATARKGWSTVADVLNTRTCEDFLAALR